MGRSGLSGKVESLLLTWSKQQPDLQDSPSVWNDLATDRTLGLGSLIQFLTPIIDDANAVSELQQTVNKHLANVHFAAATAAVSHGHKQTAKILIQTATSLTASLVHADPSLRLARMRAVCAYNFPSLDQKVSKRMASIEKSRIHIKQAAIDLHHESDSIREEVSLLQGKWAELNYDQLHEVNSGEEESTLIGCVSDAMDSYKSSGSSAEAHLALASFCDKLLLHWEDKVPTEHSAKRSRLPCGPFPHDPEVSAGDVASIIITSTFEALKFGDKGSQSASFTIPRYSS
jgi:hypothetical protein